MTGTTIGQANLDASQIHQGWTWDGAANLPAGFPAHQSGANTGGVITIRKYLGISAEPPPVVIVRSLANGCAIPLSLAVGANIISSTQSTTTSSWINQAQIAAHHEYFGSTALTPTECFKGDPINTVAWIRPSDWVGRDNGAADYISAFLPAPALQSLFAGQTFLRIRFAMPTFPATPCATGNCWLTGNEQMRYLSLELLSSLSAIPSRSGFSNSIISLNDSKFVQDPNGNVTLIVGYGIAPPQAVNAANYYTYIDLTQYSGYGFFNSLLVRQILPNPSFNCPVTRVPNYTMEYNPFGGCMGAFVPTVDFPTADQLNGPPTPPVRANSCGIAPPPPAACSLQRPPS